MFRARRVVDESVLTNTLDGLSGNAFFTGNSGLSNLMEKERSQVSIHGSGGGGSDSLIDIECESKEKESSCHIYQQL